MDEDVKEEDEGEEDEDGEGEENMESPEEVEIREMKHRLEIFGYFSFWTFLRYFPRKMYFWNFLQVHALLCC